MHKAHGQGNHIGLLIDYLKMPHAHVHETCKNLLFATFPFAPLHVCNSQNLWLNEGK
jgi:hypothetical protein